MSIKNRIITLCLVASSMTVIANYKLQGSFNVQPVELIACGKVIDPPDPYLYFLIDSILQHGLENEAALYTLLGSIKPVSDLANFHFDNTNGGNVQTRSGIDYLDRLRTIQKALNLIQLPDVEVVIRPFQPSRYVPNRRSFKVFAIRISSLDSLLKAKENFFGQFGFVPGSDPADVVVSIFEHSDRSKQFRGLGYLYGYPDYAVDFFVEAFKIQESTGQFVERNFFHIPNYGKSIAFVYAYPKDATPTLVVDSALYYRANSVLEHYRKIRPAYANDDDTVRAYEMLKDLNR